jgi:hypothetical protein
MYALIIALLSAGTATLIDGEAAVKALTQKALDRASKHAMLYIAKTVPRVFINQDRGYNTPLS